MVGLLASSGACMAYAQPSAASATHHGTRGCLGRSRKRGCNALQKCRDAVAVGIVIEPDAHHLQGKAEHLAP